MNFFIPLGSVQSGYELNLHRCKAWVLSKKDSKDQDKSTFFLVGKMLNLVSSCFHKTIFISYYILEALYD